MATSDTSSPLDPELDPLAPFVEVRYSLPVLLQEVKRDRASSSFAMEKLDQPSITALFELQQQRSRRDPNSIN